MGRHTSSDVVPFVAHYVLQSNFEDDNDILNLLYDDKTIGTWQMVDDSTLIGKKGRLYADKWSNGKHTVYGVNESEYQAGGDTLLSLIADSKAALLAFSAEVLEPWKRKINDTDIEENDAVQQTL